MSEQELPADGSVRITTPDHPPLGCYQVTQAGDLRASTITALPPATSVQVDILPDHKLVIYRSQMRRAGE